MRNKIITLILSAVAVMGAACQKDYDISQDQLLFGKLDTVSVSFALNLCSATKASVSETLVENVNLYVVNEYGDVISSGYYSSLSTIDIEIYTGMLYSVYAIANAGREIQAKSAEEIERLVYSVDNIEEMVSLTGAILMSGKTSFQKLVDGQRLAINLSRCLSKVIFKCDFSQLADDVSITIKSVQLKNIPKNINIFTDNKAVSAEDVTSSQAVVSPTMESLQSGIAFYCFENLQGTLLPDNLNQNNKFFESGSPYSQICSYMEITASYVSMQKKGDILYRFYCGKDVFGNFDLPRNHQQTITVFFTGDGAVEENTWRVDNSDIVNLVTDIIVEPSALLLYPGDEEFVKAIVVPDDAVVKDFEWSCSDTGIATVDSEGKVTAIAAGNCSIYAISTYDKSKKGECEVTVKNKEFSISPTEKELYAGESFVLNYTVKPPVKPVFSSTDATIASVDENGKVTALAEGVAKISASAHGMTLQCDVKVMVPQIKFPSDGRIMYDGEIATIPYSLLVPSDANVEVSLNNQNAELVSNDATGITIKAVTPGICTITAKIGSVSDTYTLDIQKLTITPVLSDITLYNEFYDDISYIITPSHAAGLKVNTTASVKEIVTGYNSIPNRVMPQYSDGDDTYPKTATIELSIDGRSDVSVEVDVLVKPSFTMCRKLEVNANKGNEPFIGDLEIDTHPRAQLEGKWRDKIPEDMNFNAKNKSVTLIVPTADNGEYKLYVSTYTDYDKTLPVYGECVIFIYETIWIVGTTRGSDRETVMSSPVENMYIYKYYNEIEAEWLAHPKSKHFAEGKVNYSDYFYYDGKLFAPGEICGVEEYQFSFIKGEYYEYAFNQGYFVFNGSNAPRDYIDFYTLEPAESVVYINSKGNVISCRIISERFSGGFAATGVDWEDIFDIIY